jgi:hypothetical protein
MRLGIVVTPKQGLSTEDAWDRTALPKDMYRGSNGRMRDSLVIRVVSKNLYRPVLPGPACIVKNHERPMAAVQHVLNTIRRVDGGARIVDVDVDRFDATLIRNDNYLRELRDIPLRPFCLELVATLKQAAIDDRRGGRERLPMGLYLDAALNEIEVDSRAKDLLGARLGTNAPCSATYSRSVALPPFEIERDVTIQISDTVRIKSKPRPVEGRLVRIASDGSQTRVGAFAHLVAVFHEQNHDRIIDSALANVRDCDDHPPINEFIADRDANRVFDGGHRNRHSMYADCTTSAVAFAAHRLERDLVLATS